MPSGLYNRPEPESNPALTRNPSDRPNIYREVKRGLVMRTPSVVTHDAERDTYLVLDDFGGDLVALGARPTSKALIARR